MVDTTVVKSPKVPKPKEILPDEVWKYVLTIKLLAEMLGTCPSDPNIAADFVIAKALDNVLFKSVSKEEREKIRKAIVDQEMRHLPGAANDDMLDGAPQSVKDVLASSDDAEQKGRTVFRRNAGGLILTDHMCKGFLKAAAGIYSNMFNPASRVDRFCFCGPREIPIMRDGKQLTEAEGQSVRPLRTEDRMSGVSRVCIAVSETVKAGVTLTFEVLILPKGFSSKSTGGQFKREEIRSWFEVGLFQGLGQWRSSGAGSFDVISFEEQPVTWREACDLRRKQLTALVGEPLATELAPELVGV